MGGLPVKSQSLEVRNPQKGIDNETVKGNFVILHKKEGKDKMISGLRDRGT